MMWYIGAMLFGVSVILLGILMLALFGVLLAKMIEEPGECLLGFCIIVMAFGVPIGSAMMEAGNTNDQPASSIAVEDSR